MKQITKTKIKQIIKSPEKKQSTKKSIIITILTKTPKNKKTKKVKQRKNMN